MTSIYPDVLLDQLNNHTIMTYYTCFWRIKGYIFWSGSADESGRPNSQTEIQMLSLRTPVQALKGIDYMLSRAGADLGRYKCVKQKSRWNPLSTYEQKSSLDPQTGTHQFKHWKDFTIWSSLGPLRIPSLATHPSTLTIQFSSTAF